MSGESDMVQLDLFEETRASFSDVVCEASSQNKSKNDGANIKCVVIKFDFKKQNKSTDRVYDAACNELSRYGW